MSEDPERDEGDEQSPDTQSSESGAVDDEPTAEPESESESESETPNEEPDEPPSDAGAPDEEDDEWGLSPDADRDEDSDEGEDDDDEAADASSGAGSEDRGDEGDASDEDEEADDEEPEEFTVPGMESEPVPEPDEYEPTPEPEYEREPEGEDETDTEITAVDESEVDEGIEPSDTDDGRTLPEEQDGVGVDVPEQSFGDDEEEDDGILGEGPESDEEMPLAAHIEEMMRRLAVVFAVAGVVALTLLGLGQAFELLPTAVELIDALWNNAIPGAPEMSERRPRLYGPLELVLTKLKVTALAGLLIGLPVFVYETYLFMRPGLYRNERRYYLAAVPTSLVLGTVGMAFAHYVIIPAIMEYFTVYTEENVSVAYGLAETFNLILVLMAYMAVVFQIPLFIMLAIMMGLVTRVWLEDKRLLFWGGFLTVSFLINPDPTGMTPFIIAATMIVLYEGTLALLRWTGN